MSSVMQIAMREMGQLIELANANLKYLPGPILNVGGFGAVADGETDATAIVQAAIDETIANGQRTIFFPHGKTGQYYVTELTNADQVDFIGDNCSFVGGYSGTIQNLGGLAELKADIAQRAVNVKSSPYDAKGDGVTDDTAAIQSALDSGYDVFIPEGTFMIDAVTMLKIKSNTTIYMTSRTTLKVIPNESTYFIIFSIFNVSNVRIYGNGAILQGDRYEHTGSAGEWGYGIAINNSQKIYIDGLLTKEFWGDGINLDSLDGVQANVNRYIYLKNIVSDGNRRQGISISGVEDMLIENCKFMNTGGTPPSAGIDFEPSYGTIYNRRIILRNCEIKDNGGVGIGVHNNTENIYFYDCVIDGKYNPALWLIGLEGENRFENCTINGESIHIKNVVFKGCGFHHDDTYYSNNSYAFSSDYDSPVSMIDCKMKIAGLRRFMFVSSSSSELTRKRFFGSEFIYDGNANGDFTIFTQWWGNLYFKDCKFLHTGTAPDPGIRYAVGGDELDGARTILDNVYVDPVFSSIYGQSGWVTVKKDTKNNKGVVILPVGDTFVDINHGLIASPNIILISTNANTNSWVSAFDATKLRVNIPAALGSNILVFWQASV